MRYLMMVLFGMAGLATADAVDDLKTRCWYEVPDSRLDAVDAAKDPAANPNYPGGAPWGCCVSAVMTSWSGGTYDPVHDRLLIWGGGHADYAGNEIYGFDLNALRWSRLSNPSIDVGGTPESFLYPDGNPRSLHSHKYIEYVPALDRFMIFSGVGPYPISYTGQKVFGYDFSAGKWEVGVYPDVPNGIARGANALYDPKTGNVWYRGGDAGQLCEFVTATKRWITHGPTRSVEIYGSAAIDPERRLMVLVGGYGGTRQFLAWNLSNPEAAAFVPASSGDAALETSSSPGFEFDPVSKLFVGWNGGANVYTLDPVTWKWTNVPPAAGNTVTPTAENTTGTWGRFRYVPSRNAFVLVNNTNENVFIYRFSAGTGTSPERSRPPENRISVSPNPCAAGERISVSGRFTPGHDVRACLFSLSGVRVRGQVSGFNISTRALPSGLYFLRVSADRETFTQKVVIQ